MLLGWYLKNTFMLPPLFFFSAVYFSPLNFPHPLDLWILSGIKMLSRTSLMVQLDTVLWHIYSTSTSPTRCNNSSNQLGAQKAILTQWHVCVICGLSIKKKSKVSWWLMTLTAGLTQWERFCFRISISISNLSDFVLRSYECSKWDPDTIQL